MPSGKTFIKKVSPYPIMATLTKSDAPTPFKINIVKMTNIGFLAKVDTSHFYQVGEKYEANFSLPVLEYNIHTTIKVIKTYDAIESIVGTEKVKMYTVEMHFWQINGADRKVIEQYLNKIGQEK